MIYKNNNILIASLTKFTSKVIESHFEYALPFSAMDETPAYVTGHLIVPKNSIQRIPGQFLQTKHSFFHIGKTWFNCGFFPFIKLLIHGCVTASLYFSNFFLQSKFWMSPFKSRNKLLMTNNCLWYIAPTCRYGDAVKELDYGVGVIVKKLQDLNLEKNTLVIFSSDNGGALYAKTAGTLHYFWNFLNDWI